MLYELILYAYEVNLYSCHSVGSYMGMNLTSYVYSISSYSAWGYFIPYEITSFAYVVALCAYTIIL